MNQIKPVQIEHNFVPTNGPRRLPIYFVIDFSRAAASEVADTAVQQVEQTLNQLRSLAAQNPKEYERAPVFYTVIVFRQAALQLHPLASLWNYPFMDLRLGEIEREGDSELRSALATVNKSIEHELTTPGADNGDGVPLVLLFTEKIPTERTGQILPTMKVFVCGAQSRQAPPPLYISPYLPLDGQTLLEKIQAERGQLLKNRQQMIDYPTTY